MEDLGNHFKYLYVELELVVSYADVVFILGVPPHPHQVHLHATDHAHGLTIIFSVIAIFQIVKLMCMSAEMVLEQFIHNNLVTDKTNPSESSFTHLRTISILSKVQKKVSI